jgi:hypothetical protein
MGACRMLKNLMASMPYAIASSASCFSVHNKVSLLLNQQDKVQIGTPGIRRIPNRPIKVF